MPHKRRARIGTFTVTVWAFRVLRDGSRKEVKMKKTGLFKRVLAGVLAFVMMVSYLPMYAFADDGEDPAAELREIGIEELSEEEEGEEEALPEEPTGGELEEGEEGEVLIEEPADPEEPTEPEDPVDLANKILEVLTRKDREEKVEWKKQIASYARNHYAQDKIIEELDALYKKAIEK